ncbi:uncharacterized protein LOC113159608 isoform X2 [Anabas testudineus]|uniref:uncharacterized protein LOC113159608 isoform X2 n=1 Tax=Anabas testudineus TaxID=64144 RepID=UPI000E45722D|nr:uncharacterized protein LOC113159608 isoform X2 [Anabas testudineus]
MQCRPLCCIQDPPGVGALHQDGCLSTKLPVYRCTRGTTFLESFHLILFIPGEGFKPHGACDVCVINILWLSLLRNNGQRPKLPGGMKTDRAAVAGAQRPLAPPLGCHQHLRLVPPTRVEEEQQDKHGPDGHSGYQRVMDLAHALVELRHQAYVQAQEIVSLWLKLSETRLQCPFPLLPPGLVVQRTLQDLSHARCRQCTAASFWSSAGGTTRDV